MVTDTPRDHTEPLSGSLIRLLMRRHGKTICGLAAAMKVTQARVRYVRANGVSGERDVRDWLSAITLNEVAQ